MVDINLDTQLPEVPEGCYWNVQYFEKGPYTAIPAHYQVRLLRDKEVEVVAWEFLFFQKKKRVPTQEVLESHWIKNTDSKFNGGKNNDTYVRKGLLTPEMILDAAVKIMEKMEADKKAEALLGNYPPKRLPVENES